MGSVVWLTASLFVGQVQDVQVISSDQSQASSSIISRWRSAWSERTLWHKLQERLGGTLGKTPGRDVRMDGNRSGNSAPGQPTLVSPVRPVTRVTTEEPPLLETSAPQKSPSQSSPQR